MGADRELKEAVERIDSAILNKFGSPDPVWKFYPPQPSSGRDQNSERNDAGEASGEAGIAERRAEGYRLTTSKRLVDCH